MKKLQGTKPIWHAVIWIMIYVGLTNIGDNMSSMVGVANPATAAILATLSLALLFYVGKNGWFSLCGLQRLDKASLGKTLCYVPLIAWAVMQYSKGINPELGSSGILLSIALMISVGFLEELLFRGFLYQAILKGGSVSRAVLISGVTFGIGHIVNLARGYSAADQIVQIVAAIMIGIVLALLVAVTKNLIPGILFHIFFNISGSITSNNLRAETYIVIAVLVIGAVYSVYLARVLQRQTALQGSYATAA